MSKAPLRRADPLLMGGFLFCLVGIYVTWMLSLSYILNLELPCGGSSDCERVALSAAARIGSIPLPIFGLGYYTLLGLVTLTCLFLRRPSSIFLYGLAIPGAVISTGYTIYSSVVLHAHCMWCLTSCAVSCLLAVLYSLGMDVSRITVRVAFRLSFVFVAGTFLCVSMAFSASELRRSARRFPYNPVEVAGTTFAEMSPSDSITLNSGATGPTVVMFIDLECPSCQSTVITGYPLFQKYGIRVVFRNLPHAQHPGAFDLAIDMEEAAARNKGLEFLRKIFGARTTEDLNGSRTLNSLGVTETPELAAAAAAKVTRDQEFASRLGLYETPSIFIVTPGRPPRPISRQDLIERLSGIHPNLNMDQ